MSVITEVLSAVGTGNPITGIAVKAVGGVVGSAAGAVANSGLNAISNWVLSGTESALKEVAHLISTATAPNLTSSWFSSTYWRVAGLATLLTVPFVFAAMLQAILRSDLALIGKVVFTYLPVSLLAVSLAAPVAMLLLSATDQMCGIVSAGAVGGGASFLDRAGVVAGGLSAAEGSPFFAVLVGLFAVAAALMLALELIVREAAVYVVVLMLPLAFAAFVWPARRIWAIRMVELLVSLILSKFVIVAVLSLAGAALTSSDPGISQLLTATALLLLSTFAPWALMRILPFTELGAGAGAALRHELPHARSEATRLAGRAAAGAEGIGEIAMALPAMLRRDADQAGQGHVRDDGASASSGGAERGVSGPRDRSQNSGAAPGLGASMPTPQPGGDSAEIEAAAATAAQTAPAAAHTRFLSEIDPRLHFDLETGEWIEPGDDE